MRLKKGSRVEVRRKKEAPPGSWWCAEIISGNGHTYSVKYYDVDGTVERVPRKFIRPCPPPVEGLRSWVSGDIIEVFERHSWKLAEVSSVACGNCFHVRLLGTHRPFKTHKSIIRWRQAWEEDKWIVIRKTTRQLNSQRRGELERKYVADDDFAESNNMHAPVFRKKGTNNQNPRAAAVGHFIGSTEPNNDADDQSVSSSVGSCSPDNGSGSHLHHPVNFATHIDWGSEGDDDDAESLSSSRRRRGLTLPFID